MSKVEKQKIRTAKESDLSDRVKEKEKPTFYFMQLGARLANGFCQSSKNTQRNTQKNALA